MNKRIKEIRKSLNLTQEEFATKLSITRGALSRIESGDRNPSSQTIELICSKFNVCREWLEFGTGEMQPEAPGWDELVSRVMRGENDFARQTMAAFCALSDEQWQQLRDILDTLKKAGL